MVASTGGEALPAWARRRSSGSLRDTLLKMLPPALEGMFLGWFLPSLRCLSHITHKDIFLASGFSNVLQQHRSITSLPLHQEQASNCFSPELN